MRIAIHILFWLLMTLSVQAQQQAVSASLSSALDSIAMGSGKEKHFGELYLKSTFHVEKYSTTLPEDIRVLVARLEEKFADYFFEAVTANNNSTVIPAIWQNYFKEQLSPLQLKLIGANAHINGDLSHALIDNFSLAELKLLKPYYKVYGKLLAKEFNNLFYQAKRSDKRLRNLHIISLGLDKLYGRMMLKKWRRRQLQLAFLKFEDPNRFVVKQRKIGIKRKRIDKLIMRRLYVTA